MAVGKKYERNGQMMTISQIADETGLHIETVRRQILKKGDANLVGREQVQETPPPLMNGKQYTWTELGRMAGVSHQTIRDRIHNGMTAEEAVAGKKRKRYPSQKGPRCSEETKQELLKLWDCGERCIEEVERRSGVPREIISVVLPVDEILEQERRDVLRKFGYAVKGR